MANEKTEIEKLNLNSMNISEEKQHELFKLFPEIRTEGGKIDFEKLKLSLGELVETGKERYGMNWPGKAECFKTIQAPSLGTLIPEQKNSLKFEESENLIIDGDNLEALKLLQKGYFGKIKLIYIDPPYNTGDDFIYPDNYTENLSTYLEYTGQVDSSGKKFGTNTETDGRFHSKWLNMMYPRLFLARNLMREDGVIFISIDDREVSNLRKLCDEIFGEECFLASVIWQKRTSPDARTALGAAHDYILCYVKTATDKKTPLNLIPLSQERTSSFKNPDDDARGPWASVDLTGQTGHATASQFYKIKTPSGQVYGPPDGRCWALAEANFKKLVDEGRIWFGKDGDSRPRLKQYLSETEGMTAWTWWDNSEVGHNQEATKELAEILGQNDVFSSPKPVRLLKRILQLATKPNTDDIVLDFFAGSGTLGQTVLELNAEDKGNRKFILVQLPEILDPSIREHKSAIDFCSQNKLSPVITSVTRERIRRAIERLKISDGFRAFKLSDSNFKTWGQDTSKESLETQLELHVDHVRHERTADEILYEILLKSGFPLATKVETQKIGKQIVYSIAGGMLLVCLEDNLTLDLIKHIAEQKPERVVCLDQGFANNDQLKANAVQIFRTKGIASFKTV